MTGIKKYLHVLDGLALESFEIEGDVTTMFHPSWVMVDVTDISPQPSAGWSANKSGDEWVFSAPIAPEANAGLLAESVRQQRDGLLRGVYDPSIIMAQRMLRMASTPEAIAYAKVKITELDAYAELLASIPDQAGFPIAVNWPVAPSRD